MLLKKYKVGLELSTDTYFNGGSIVRYVNLFFHDSIDNELIPKHATVLTLTMP